MIAIQQRLNEIQKAQPAVAMIPDEVEVNEVNEVNETNETNKTNKTIDIQDDRRNRLINLSEQITALREKVARIKNTTV